MSKILVTGGAGFVGSHLARMFSNNGHEVVILDDLSGGCLGNVPNEIEFIQGSICNVSLVNEIMEAGKFDYVYHLAAYAAEGLSHFIKRFNYENNVIGSVNLITAAVNNDVKGFGFFSSVAVYGDNPDWLTEYTVPTPIDPYGIAKYTVEMELEATRKQFGLPYVIFRAHNVYGPHQNLNDPYRNVVGIFLRSLLLDKPLPIFGDGSQERNFTYIDDVVTGVRDVFEEQQWNQIFNIGSDESISVLDMAKACAETMEKELKIEFLPARPEAHKYNLSHKRINPFMNPDFEPTSLGNGLCDTVGWIQINKMAEKLMAPQPFKQIDITRNLPPSWQNL